MVHQPFDDQEVIFEGTPITGTLIGTETQFAAPGGPTLHIGYFADVTSLVAARGPGVLTFAFADGDPASNLTELNGVSLVVAYTNASDSNTYRVLIWDGLDFAAGADPTPGDNRVTSPVTFNYGTSPDQRAAELFVITGGAQAALADEITISNNPTVFDSLDGSEGSALDLDRLLIAVPAGVGSTTVQLVAPMDLIGPPTGCGPGFWRSHGQAWVLTGYTVGTAVGSVFVEADGFPQLASMTLFQALGGGGGPGTAGAARILLRAGVAALLNAAHPDLNYPRSVDDVIADVDEALASNDRPTMLSLAAALDEDNNLSCEFGAGDTITSDSLLWQVAMLRILVPPFD
ncbi:MAG TPA: hypothetical protein VHL09_16630 [Dehalococcoidia bacterium]|nr:hypothetical protein [Dehalococcoidia bacterium]